jgi:hypothetical protein
MVVAALARTGKNGRAESNSRRGDSSPWVVNRRAAAPGARVVPLDSFRRVG